MRLRIHLLSQHHVQYQEINQYFIQSWIWSLLQNTEFSKLHDQKYFKYFTFSNLFPVVDLTPNQTLTLLVASPDEYLLQTLQEQMLHHPSFFLGQYSFLIKQTTLFSVPLGRQWITATPLVLYKDNYANTYFSFYRDADIEFFLERIKENAVKKYVFYFNKKPHVPRHLFTEFLFKRSVAKAFSKEGKPLVFLGTYGVFTLPQLQSENMELFYRFLLDCGLGEKNSLGFGFMNPIR
ncbi:MAG: CRISPR-associated endoribonuclease Cas6 [Candidatus Woesearchaeota archaeon]